MKRRRISAADAACPCGKALTYAGCCGRWHDGEPAPDAETLMRSRYTAYALRRADYLLATWHRTTRPPVDDLADIAATHWLGLTVLGHVSIEPERAQVTFTARFKHNGRAGQMHETSRFVREGDRWFYLDGTVAPA